MENDMINDLIEFPELDAFNASKTFKRRSSILKTFDSNVLETNREERKSTRRVSWAQTYQYKELLADGTTFIISQQMAKSSEENIGSNEPKPDNCCVDINENTGVLNKSNRKRKQQIKINARDFVKKLRNVGNCSQLSCDQNSPIESPNRRSMRIANRSVIQTIDENSENGSPNLNALNNDNLIELRDSVDMELTSLNSSTSIDQNVGNSDSMSVKMSIEEETVDNISETKVFTDNDMEMTINSSQESELIKFNSIEEPNGEKNGSNVNSKQLNRMLNTTMISNYSLLDLSNTNSFINSNNEQNLIENSDMELTPLITSISNDSKQNNDSSDCSQNKSNIAEKSNKQINSTKVFTDNDMEMTFNSETQESELIKFNTTEENSSDKNHFDIHNTTMISNVNLIDSNSLIDSSRNYHSILNDEFSKTDHTKPIDEAIDEISVEDIRRSDKESFGVTNMQCDNELYLSGNSMANLNRNYSFLTDPFTARLEMVKSNIKDSLGLSIKHKLKQKRQELEAKRKQTEDLVSSSANIIMEDKDNEVISGCEVSKTISSLIIDDSESTMTDTSKDTLTNDDNQELSTAPLSEVQSILSNVQNSDSSSSSSSTSKDTPTLISETNDANSVFTLFSHSDTNSNGVEPNSSSILIESLTNIISNPLTSIESDSSDPFIHTDHSFQDGSTFYKTLSPLQLSFIVREDTLCLLADELDGKVKDVLLPMEKSIIERETMRNNEILDKSVLDSDYKALSMKYEQRTEQRTIISFLWGSFILDIKFGDCFEIVNIDMNSLIDVDNPLNLRQQNLVWKFRDEHKPLLSVAHQLIISSFESKKEHILNKYKTSSQLNDLLSDELMDIVFRAKSLLTELRILSSFVICQLLPKDNDHFNFVVELIGLRKTIYLILPINPEVYPFAVIKPKFIIRSEERDIYCLTNFTAALLRIKPGFNYIQRLIKAAKFFIKAMKKIIIDQQKNLRQKREIEFAKLPFN